MLYGQLSFYNDKVKKSAGRFELSIDAKNLYTILKRSLELESTKDVSSKLGYSIEQKEIKIIQC